MKIKRLSLGPLGTNCYIIYKGKEALIIDPGEEAEKIIHFLQGKELRPHAILLTHAHFDHIGAVEEVRYHYNIDVYLHENEENWLEDPSLNGSIKYPIKQIKTKKPEQKLLPGKLGLGKFSFEIIHTPGHSPGSVSFIFHDEQITFSGDVLFRRGIGRTDLIEGSAQQLEASIQDRLYQLDDSYTVYPGHGGTTTIGDEKLNNPYVSPKK